MECGDAVERNASAASLTVTGRPFVCEYPQCGRAFFKRSKLNRHAATHLAVGAYRCAACQRTFHRSEHLRRHMITHSAPIKSFKCSIIGCAAAFATRSHLSRHIRAHDKVYVCAESGCTETFDKHHKLRAHRRLVHDGVMPHACSLCDQSFESHSLLLKHNRLTHTPDRFICGYEHCGQTFARFLIMKKHIDDKHKQSTKKDTKLTCSFDLCNKQYSSQSALNEHCRSHHRHDDDDNATARTCALCQRIFTHKHTLQRHEYLFHTEAGYKERQERREQSAVERVRRALCGKAEGKRDTQTMHIVSEQLSQRTLLSPPCKRQKVDIHDDEGDELDDLM